MNDIQKEKAGIWCERFYSLMKENALTQKSFIKKYQERFGPGITQANVSRWMHVGGKTGKEDNKTIGFPSYENMINVADLFGVTVSYLTGESDYRSFEMEKTCQFLGIDEKTGEAIKNLTSEDGMCTGNDGNSFKQNSVLMRKLLTSKSFPGFLNAVNTLNKLTCSRNEETQFQSEIGTSSENSGEGSTSGTEVGRLSSDSIDPELNIRLIKYELQETYFKLAEEMSGSKL